MSPRDIRIALLPTCRGVSLVQSFQPPTNTRDLLRRYTLYCVAAYAPKRARPHKAYPLPVICAIFARQRLVEMLSYAHLLRAYLLLVHSGPIPACWHWSHCPGRLIYQGGESGSLVLACVRMKRLPLSPLDIRIPQSGAHVSFRFSVFLFCCFLALATYAPRLAQPQKAYLLLVHRGPIS